MSEDQKKPERNALGQYVPGVSGNTSGRPKIGYTFADLLEKYLNLNHEKEKILTKKSTKKDKVVSILMEKALSGNIKALKMVMERIDGKVPDFQVHYDGEVALDDLADVLSNRYTEGDEDGTGQEESTGSSEEADADSNQVSEG